MVFKSPITGGNDVTLLERVEADELIRHWKEVFQIDITEELHGHKEIALFRCNETKVEFFAPFDIAGSGKLYEKLARHDWYYMARKWEHDVALEDLKGCGKTLEVGCGEGAFVERLRKEAGLIAEGVELSQTAVVRAVEKAIPVSQVDVQELAKEKSGYFDAVCAFQVLEHVPDLRGFLGALVELVRPGGKLIVSVPNSESFLKYSQNNLLDQPPHHMSRWSHDAFENLTSFFPIRVKHFRLEPLAEYHVDWYLSVQLSRMPRIWPLRGFAFRISGYVLIPVLKKWSLIRNFIQGHTLYVCFEKKC